jgi:hypothetical protein
MARLSRLRRLRTVEPARPGWDILPDWIQRQVAQLPHERLHCLDGKVRNISRVRQINRTGGQIWYVVTTVEDELDAQKRRTPEEVRERSICEMEPTEPLAVHARFTECEPDYLDSYRAATVSLKL